MLMSALSSFMPEEADLIIDGCEPLWSCSGLNSGPLEGQTVFLSAEPSLQPGVCNS